MSTKLFSQRILIITAFICLTTTVAFAQTTEFSYQGRLSNPPGTPANGNYDFQFMLFDAATGGVNVAGQQRLNVAVTGGVFNVSLDFGAGAFPGANRLLEIAVRPAGGGVYTVLSPRQPILSAPYAIKSLSAATADNSTSLGGVNALNFVQQDAGGNVAISGGLTVNGTLSLDTVNAQTQYNIGGQRVLSSPGGQNLFAGFNAGISNVGGTAFNNSFFGNQAGQSNNTGSSNSFSVLPPEIEIRSVRGIRFLAFQPDFKTRTARTTSISDTKPGNSTLPAQAMHFSAMAQDAITRRTATHFSAAMPD